VNGSESGGFGMVRYRIAPEHMIMALPDDLSFEHAAIGNCSFGVGYTACEESGVKAGDVVIVGGVGFIGFGMIANALYRNATVVVLGRHEYRMEMCRQMGVHAIINPDDSDWLAQLHEFTGDRKGADVAFECSGAPYYLDKCFEGLRRYGTLFSAGHAGSQKYSLSILNDLIDRHIVWTGGHDVRFQDRSGLVRMLADPEVQRHTEIVNTHTFPMSNAAEAFEVALSKNCGKIYLLPNQ
jgi:threonine 3-dehydrogenase